MRLLYLARELKHLREHADVRVKDACAALGISQPTFSRIENATQLPTPGRVDQLLELYGAPIAKRAELMHVAREASKHGLWQTGADIWPSGYVNLERDADDIFAFELVYVPGLLQTDEYYRALLRVGENEPQDPADIDRKVAGRIGRQSLLSREAAPHLHVVLSEAVIRQMVGGAAVMRRQLMALRDSAQRENVTLQIVPFSAGVHRGMPGAFAILTFDAYKMQIGYTEGPGGHIYLESAVDVSGINLRREGVLKAALSPSESADLLQEAADSFV